MDVICISGKAGSGKDTVADFLKDILESREKSVVIFHYADLLKFICSKYFGWDGKKDEQGRTLLQYVGTDVVRKKYPGFWVSFFNDFIELFYDQWDYIIVPDCRFPNEIWGVLVPDGKKDYKGVYKLRIERPGYDNGLTEEQKQHPSETSLDNETFDYTIINEGDGYGKLYAEVLKYAEEQLHV